MSEQPVGAVAASSGASRSDRLDRVISDLLRQTPELEAAAVVSFDGLPMAAALPASMDEDRVAAMSAALLSLGERATQSLGRGDLSQVYIEGETGTVFLISADNEAVLVAVAAAGAKVGMMLFEVRRAAAAVADVLRTEETEAGYDDQPEQFLVADKPMAQEQEQEPSQPAGRDEWMPQYSSVPAAPAVPARPVAPMQAGPLEPAAWTSYSASASLSPGEPPAWS